MEFFDVVDINGKPTGEKVERCEAHNEGIKHRTSHVWIVRRREGVVQILLQKRSSIKDSFPGCYDISSAGHIPSGEDFLDSAVRELYEELGVRVQTDQLISCGIHRKYINTEFYGEKFIDDQVSKVFLLWLDVEESDFTLQEEEVESVKWYDYVQCKRMVKENTIPNCIDIQELEMLEEHFK